VIRTRERVLLDDASVGNLYSEDEYVRQKGPRSILCLPIVKQTKLVGAFYLENNLTPCAFTSDRVTVLELLASQAAISLENASLPRRRSWSGMLRTAEEPILPMGEASRKRWVCPYRRAHLYLQSKTETGQQSRPRWTTFSPQTPSRAHGEYRLLKHGYRLFGRSSWFQSRDEGGMS
jgi:GAF domain